MRGAVFLVGACIGAWVAAGLLASVDLPRGSLWQVVRACKLAKRAFGTPFPCLSVQAGPDGYAILRDFEGRAHFIVTPVEPVAGLESLPEQAALASGAWLAALATRSLVASQTGTPLGDVVLAVNPRRARSQDQFHIHVACADALLIDRIRSEASSIGPTWSPLADPVDDTVYWARRVARSRTRQDNPFASLRRLRGSHIDPGDVVFEAFGLTQDGDGDLVQLATEADDSSAEDAVDQECSGRRQAPERPTTARDAANSPHL